MGYYRREQLLPKQAVKSGLKDILFGGVAKPVFTTDNAHNHLISLSEVLCMYLLVWSPLPWQGLVWAVSRAPRTTSEAWKRPMSPRTAPALMTGA